VSTHTTEYGTYDSDAATTGVEETPDTSAEEFEGTDEFDEGDETTTGSTGSSGRSGSSASRQVGRDKALIRRALAKHAQVEAASSTARTLAGEMLGVDGSDAADLTVAALTTGRGQSSALSDLASLRGEDDMAAAAMAATLPNDRLTALWRVLVALGGAKGSKPSGSGVQRALNVVKAARGLTDEQVASLDDAVALTKKTV